MAGGTFHGPTAFQVGDHNTQHSHFHTAPRAPVSLPHQVGVVPSRAQSFLERAEAGALREAFSSGGSAVSCQVLAGMGGAGKTQLAADHALRAWSEGGLEVLMWVTATARTAIVDAYAHAAADLCGADLGDPEQAAEAFLAWLQAKNHRWLIVLDDLTDPADLRGLWPPDRPEGRTLVTTRRRDAVLTGTRRKRIDVGLFTTGDATRYLAATLAAHGRSEPVDELVGLAEDLGHLPLALSQAAAYVTDQALDVAAYRSLLSDRALTPSLPGPGALPDDQRGPLTATWTLSVDLADRQDPAGVARPLLALASMLDAHGILESVLTSRPARDYLAANSTRTPPRRKWWRWASPPRAVTGQEVHQSARLLHRLNLIDHTPQSPHQSVRVHALVQRTTRESLASCDYEEGAHAAADALLCVWPKVERDTDLAQALRANTAALAAHASSTGCLDRPHTHHVLFRAGNSLGNFGQASAAADYFQRQRAASTTHLGADHPYVLSLRHDAVYWRGKAGDAASATPACADLLEDRLRVLGPNHPHTLATRGSLAHLRAQGGDAAGAVSEFARLLDHMVRVLGPDHPNTLAVRGNLAENRGAAGDAPGAAAAFAQLLNDTIRVLGSDHPNTLATRSSLAGWHGRAGDANGAAVACAAVLDDHLRILGPDHPDTLATRSNLAHWRGEAGAAAEAASAFADLLGDVTRVLGPDHPQTLVARGNLARWRAQQGEAATFADVLDDMVRLLGPDHPHTLVVRDNLAQWQKQNSQGPGASA